MKCEQRNEVDKVLEIVEFLPWEDQRRLARLVELLSESPDDLRRRSQRMLRSLVASRPASRRDCLDRMDAIIRYIEDGLNSDSEAVPGKAGPLENILSP